MPFEPQQQPNRSSVPMKDEEIQPDEISLKGSKTPQQGVKSQDKSQDLKTDKNKGFQGQGMRESSTSNQKK